VAGGLLSYGTSVNAMFRRAAVFVDHILKGEDHPATLPVEQPTTVGAYYPAEVVTISGTAKEFTHAAASGGKMQNYFCPQCGSTVYWKVSNLPAMIGVALGAMADPKYPAPVISVFEQSKHDWVEIGGAVEHFRQSYVPKNSI
jgi:hypothetical protein